MAKKKKQDSLLKTSSNHFLKGIYAGIAIGIGGTIFLASENKVIGSLLFSIGLLTVCMYGMNLYTGKIGYVINNKISYLWELFLTLIGNFVGTFIVGFSIRSTRFTSYIDKAINVSNTKLNDNLLSIFILSCFCGILMYIAVNSYKKFNDSIAKHLPIIMCVTVFILAGFEHCVANMFYFSVANMWSVKTILYTIVMVLGNSLGAIIIALFDKLYNK